MTYEPRTREKRARDPRPLDEETIELVRRQIGIPIRRSPRHHNEICSSDSFRHFANAYGDDNPLYCDVEHATASSWGTPIGPPLYPNTAGVMRPVTWSPAEQEVMGAGDPLAGIGQYMCGERWVFLRPVRPGDVLHRSQCLFSAELKDSRFGDGRGALLSHRISWEDAEGGPYAYRFLDFWHADRDATRRTGRTREVALGSYTDDDLERIDALHEAETVRGASPLTTRDVRAGDGLGPIVKGPLAVTDVVAWHTGQGMGDFGVRALKLGFKNRRRVPAFYQKNEMGYWDAAMRAHWDPAWAARLGHPAPYDYGVMRTNWLVHVVNNWMGDDAWIWKLSSSVRRFNYIGDVHEVSGVVREVDHDTSAVTVDVQALNQRGETTADGRVVVLLPRAGGGHAELPAFRPEDVPEAQAP